jgi:hypothetical protein
MLLRPSNQGVQHMQGIKYEWDRLMHTQFVSESLQVGEPAWKT